LILSNVTGVCYNTKMDRSLRTAVREHSENPCLETFLSLLVVKNRAGELIDLTSELVNDYWEDVIAFLRTVNNLKFRICDYEVRRVVVTRTFLIGQVRYIAGQDMATLTVGVMEGMNIPTHRVRSVYEQVRASRENEFSIVGIAFQPNGEGAGVFYLVTENRAGFADHTIDLECEDDFSSWDCVTSYPANWSELDLSYSDPCGDDCGRDERAWSREGYENIEMHMGTEEHVLGIDERRHEAARNHFIAHVQAEGYLDLKIQGV